MKGDFSRRTFARERHFDGVLLQQGRVLVDAEFNEQQAIDRYRDEVETRDVVGPSGIPLDPPDFTHASGFATEITADGGTFTIGAGRCYVDGVLCENERLVAYEDQPDLIAPEPFQGLLSDDTIGLVYLDAWSRHITGLDDPRILERALGEADTTTRIRTTWQVKVLPVPVFNPDHAAVRALLSEIETLTTLLAGTLPEEERATKRSQLAVRRDALRSALGVGCATSFAGFARLLEPEPGSGRLTARTDPPQEAATPCLAPPSAGYTRLENQLYRVEVHRGGVYPPSSSPLAPGPTWKWSRENGSIVTAIDKVTAPDRVTVASLGRDEVLGFALGDWVEVVNDATELDTDGRVLGHLCRIAELAEAALELQLSPAPPADLLTRNPKLRRWDHVGDGLEDGIAITGGEVDLEDGLKVAFSEGSYRSGAYWLIPARTATGEIEWPPYALPNVAPEACLPAGVEHHYCRLALIMRNGASGKLSLVSDCRALFPPLTEQVSFFFLGGDGQEVMPDAASPTTPVTLPARLDVGVANGGRPVAGAVVQFEFVKGGGLLQGSGGPVAVATAVDGVASCECAIDGSLLHHEVEATLLGDAGELHAPIIFSARPSIAAQVRYTPDPKCTRLKGSNDVQAALTTLAATPELSYVGGDGQEAMPGQALAQPLEVAAWSACGPLAAWTVRFALPAGVNTNGTLAPGNGLQVSVTTDASGIARCNWTLGQSTPTGQVVAQLFDANGNAVGEPVHFSGRVSVASKVAYTPNPNCARLTGSTDVQTAISTLAATPALAYVGGDGQQAMPGGSLPQPLEVAAWSACGPLSNWTVKFRIPAGNGQLSGGTGLETNVQTDANGVASCGWTLDQTSPAAPAVARLLDGQGNAVGEPVHFYASVSVAEQVAFHTDCEYLKETTTVQEALERLCARPSGDGGGCSIVIRPGDDVQKVVADNWKRRGGVCFCLVPGDYSVEDFRLEGHADEGIELAGCAAGVRLRVEEGWTMLGIGKVTIRDIEFILLTQQASLDFDHCSELTVEDCSIERRDFSLKPLCRIRGSQQIELRGNRLESHGELQRDFVPSLKGLYQAPLRVVAIEQAMRIAEKVDPGELRIEMEEWVPSMDEGVPVDERRAYMDLLAMLSASVDRAVLLRRLIALRDAAAASAEPGSALAILDAEAETWVTDNHLIGALVLSGTNRAQLFTLPELTAFHDAQGEGQPLLLGTGRSLYMRDNRLARVVMDDLIRSRLTSLKPGEQVGGLFSTVHLDGNVIDGVENLIIAPAVRLTANHFRNDDLSGGEYDVTAKLFADVPASPPTNNIKVTNTLYFRVGDIISVGELANKEWRIILSVGTRGRATRLVAGATSGGTAIKVASAIGFAAPGPIRVGSETVTISSIAARQADGTVINLSSALAQSHSLGEGVRYDGTGVNLAVNPATTPPQPGPLNQPHTTGQTVQAGPSQGPPVQLVGQVVSEGAIVHGTDGSTRRRLLLSASRATLAANLLTVDSVPQ